MEEIDLKELFEMFWHKKAQIILIILIFMVIGVIYSVGFVTPMYSSSTTLVLAGTASSTEEQTTNTITTADLSINSQLVSTYSELVKSNNILGQVISNLGINIDAEELRKNIEVTSVEDTELIEITVSNENPEYAAKIANEIASVFEEKIAKEIYNINNVHIVDEATPETEPSNVNHIKDIVIFAFIGAITPGPDILLVIRNTLYFGILQGLKIWSGIATGWFIFLSIIYFGFAHVLRGNLIQLILSIIGGAYLLYIAYLLCTKSTSKLELENHFITPDGYLKALLVNISNPKAILFFSVIIAPFIQTQLLTSLSILFAGLSSAFLSIIVICAFFRNYINERVFYIIDKVCAVLFIIFSIMLFYHGYTILFIEI